MPRARWMSIDSASSVDHGSAIACRGTCARSSIAARLVHALEGLSSWRVFVDLGRHAGLGDRCRQLLGFLTFRLFPSSFWICFNCSRSTYSRWRSSIASLVFLDLARQLQHLDAARRCVDTRSSRHGLGGSSSSCFSAGLMSRLAMVSARAAGDSIAWIEFASSAGACGSSVIASTAFCFSRTARLDLGMVHSGSSGRPRAQRDAEATHGVEYAKAPLALARQVVGAVGRGHVTDDRRGRADPVQLVERRVLGLGVLLQQETVPCLRRARPPRRPPPSSRA